MKLRYPVHWIAQYANGKIIKESDKTNFKTLRKKQVISFGAEGPGIRVGFLVSDGVISVNGRELRVALEVAGAAGVYPLTGRGDIVYNDLIQYKDADTTLLVGPKSRMMDNMRFITKDRITQYNIGYKCKGKSYELGDWWYQVIVHIPITDVDPVCATLRLVCEKGFKGKTLISWGNRITKVNALMKPKTTHEMAVRFG